MPKLKSVFSSLSLLCLVGLSACGVELRDRNKVEPVAVNEIIVDSEYAVPVPKVLNSQVVMKVDRLVLKPGAKFFTNGLNIKLQIGELVSEDGTIATFPERRFADAATLGRSGGNLELFIDHAVGKLKVEMRGEAGGRGAAAPPPDATLNGGKGAAGEHVKCIATIAAGIMPLVLAKTGAQGQQGLPGFRGAQGLKGGDSGMFSAVVRSGQNFEIAVAKIPGKGGPGGFGGKGGLGGPGGDPGNEFCTPGSPDTHTYAVTGPPGVEGPQGPDGAVGADGNIQGSCVAVAGGLTECSNEPTFVRGLNN